MSGQKWKPAPSYRPKGVKLPGRLDAPNLTARDFDMPERQAVTDQVTSKRAAIRALTMVATIVALAVSAAPVAWAGLSKQPPRGTWTGVHEYGHINNIVTDNKDPDKLGAARNHGTGVIESVNVKYT